MSDNKGTLNGDTVNVLTSVLEIFATGRSALSTYAVAMSVTGGDQTFSLFTVAVVELALVLSMLAIGYDVISPVTAIVALGFSIVMQWTEISLLQGTVDENGKNLLRMALAFAPSAVLALGILRRLVTGQDDSLNRLIGTVRGWFQGKDSKQVQTFALEVDAPSDKPKAKRIHRSKDNDTPPLA